MSLVMRETGPEQSPERRQGEAETPHGAEESLHQREPGMTLPFGPANNGGRTLRIGGAPSAKGRAASPAGDDLAASLAVVQTDLASLRMLGETWGEANAAAAAKAQKDVATIKDSIEHVEAYLSVALVPKLDQMLGEKLTVVQSVLASKRRLRRWLMLSLFLNVLLVAGAVVEAQTGAVMPLVQAYGLQLSALVGEAGAIASDWARAAMSWISQQF